ncbi:MAG: amino acid ABC transporter substrate-binding protein, partial [Crocosphaera sp.]
MNLFLNKYRLKSPLAWGLALAFSSSLLAGCNNPTPTNTGTTPTASGNGLKIGALLPVTGDLASIGANMPEAVKLAVEEINACDGVNG